MRPYNNQPIAGWAPKSQAQLKAAIAECLKLSPDCDKGPHGSIGSWDVSAVTDMTGLFDKDAIPATQSFNGDISNLSLIHI